MDSSNDVEEVDELDAANIAENVFGVGVGRDRAEAESEVDGAGRELGTGMIGFGTRQTGDDGCKGRDSAEVTGVVIVWGRNVDD